MPNCDLCGITLSENSGCVVPADLIKGVAKHPEFSLSMIKVDDSRTLADMYKIVDDGEAHWRGLVMKDTTPWFLCPRCQALISPFTLDYDLGDLRDLISKKLIEIESRFPSHPGRQWLKESIFTFISEHMDDICIRAAAGIKKAEACQDAHLYLFHKNGISAHINAFHIGSQQAHTTYYKNGYFYMIDSMRLGMKKMGYANNTLLHFQFFTEDLRTNLFYLSLTVFPSKKEGSSVAFVFPEEFLSSDEKKMIDNTEEKGAPQASAANKKRRWWQFWST